MWPGRRRAAITEPMSPTNGASIGWLLSNSDAAMSTCTNFASGDHCGESPCPSSQFSRAPTSKTASARATASERAAAADCGWESGSSPLAIDIGRNGIPVASTNSRITSSAWAYAAPLPSTINGRCACASTCSARSTASGAGNCRGAGSTTRHTVLQRRRRPWLDPDVAGDVEVNTARTAGDCRADSARDAAPDVLDPADPVGRLHERPRGVELVKVLVVAPLQIHHRSIAGTRDQDHRKTVRGGIGQCR